MKKTIVVNLFGGPGAGKSTLAHGLVFYLKNIGINCEYASEYAKDLIFDLEKPKEVLTNNQYEVFQNQKKRIERYIGKTDVVVTDSPIALFLYYDTSAGIHLRQHYLQEFLKNKNYNIFVERNHDYNAFGRYQTEEESEQISFQIKNILVMNNIEHDTIQTQPNIENSFIDIKNISNTILSLIKPSS